MVSPSFGKSLVGGSMLALLAHWSSATSIPVANPSFESPVTNYVNINIDSWQKSPQPADYDSSGGFSWEQLSGTFKNTAPGSSDHIDNVNGAQAIYLFADPEVGLAQELAAIFQVDRSFDLTVGVIGGGGGMLDDASLELRFFYRDALGQKVTIATTEILQSIETFPSTNHLVDFQLHLAPVQTADPWAGQHIGLEFFSTTSAELEGGYWDLDNVRLVSTMVPEPSSITSLSFAGGLLLAGRGRRRPAACFAV